MEMGNKITFEVFCTKKFWTIVSCEIFGLTGNVITFNVISGHNLMVKLYSFSHKNWILALLHVNYKKEWIRLSRSEDKLKLEIFPPLKIRNYVRLTFSMFRKDKFLNTTLQIPLLTSLSLSLSLSLPLFSCIFSFKHLKVLFGRFNGPIKRI